MAIELNCPHCHKSLKTADEKAGWQATCPGCGQVIQVPDHVQNSTQAFVAAVDGTVAPVCDDRPIVAEPAADTKPCPFCCETIKAAAIRCRFCGEVLDRSRFARRRLGIRSEVRPFPVFEVIEDAWSIFLNNLGLAIGAFLMTGLIIAMASLLPFGPFILSIALLDQNNDTGGAIAGIFGFLLYVGTVAFCFYILPGYFVLQIKLAREQSANFDDLFSGARFCLRFMISAILFSLMCGLGFVTFLAPGVLVAVMFFPFAFVLVDDDPPGIQCLWRAKELTTGNWGSILFVFLVSFAIISVSSFCYLGFLFGLPFINLLLGVAYVRMKNQAPVRAFDHSALKVRTGWNQPATDSN